MATFQVTVGDAEYEVDAPDEKTAWKMANDVHLNSPQESPSMQSGRRLSDTTPGSMAQGAVNAAQGLTFGFADEIAGLAAKLFGGDYNKARDYVRGMTAQYRQDYPVGSAITEAMAGAPTALIGGPTMAAVKGATAITPLAKAFIAARTGAGQGAVSGAGESTAEDPFGVATDTAKGGALGGGLAASVSRGGSGIFSVGENIAQRFSRPAAEKAARVRLAEVLQRSVPDESVYTQTGAISTPAGRASARLERYGREATIADVSGAAGRRELDVLATMPGRTEDAIEKLIRARQASRGERLVIAADETLGIKGKGYVSTLDLLEKKQRQAQAPFRKQLEGFSVRADDELMKILNREPAAFKAAADLAIREGKIPIDLSKLKAGDDIPFDALDTVKKTLWTIAEKEKVNFKPTAESRAVNGIRVALIDKLDRLSPKDAGGSIYKQARDAFAGPAELRSAVEAGRGAMKVDAIAVKELTNGMSLGELEAFRIGALQSLRDKVGTEAGQTSLLKMWKEPATSGKLREIFGSDYRKFSVEVAKEARLKLLEKTGAGSQTASRLLGAEDTSSALADAVPLVSNVASGNVAPVVGGVTKFFGRIGTPEETRNQLAKLLMLRGQPAQKELKAVDRLIRQLNLSASDRASLTGGLLGQATTQGNYP